MYSFIISLVALTAGYLIYGKVTERLFKIDPQRTPPAIRLQDGVDYVPMKPWRIFLIQFLNIAGLGPIFGAIMGAKFGPSSFLWIVFGCIFGGAVHDYLSGMISLRHDGESLPEIHGRYLGNGVKQTMRAFSVILMVMVGAVFVSGPAALLASLTPTALNYTFWIVLIFLYYIVATLVPIDKIIGRIYPVFGFCMLFMAVGILVAMLVKQVPIPEFWDGLQNRMPDKQANPIFPMMFISIACGAVSGFHATQSPLMARCMTHEKQGRTIFFGAMIMEGVIALIWAAAASYFFFDNALGKEMLASGDTNASLVVNRLCRDWLGPVGAVLAILGVVAAPITSGDTAFRSARLIVGDFLHYNQKPVKNRLLVAIPLFTAGLGILLYSMHDAQGFDKIWRYFAWANQTLAAVTFWALSVYLAKERSAYVITLVPALFMTMVVMSFILIMPNIGFGLPALWAYGLSGAVTLGLLVLFYVRKRDFCSQGAAGR